MAFLNQLWDLGIYWQLKNTNHNDFYLKVTHKPHKLKLNRGCILPSQNVENIKLKMQKLYLNQVSTFSSVFQFYWTDSNEMFLVIPSLLTGRGETLSQKYDLTPFSINNS